MLKSDLVTRHFPAPLLIETQANTNQIHPAQNILFRS